MRKSTLFLLLLFASLGSRPAAGLSPESAPAATAQSPQAIADIDAFIDRVMATGGTVGMSVSVVRGGETVYSKGFGYADREAGRAVTPDTLFYIASTTKSFTALAGALLAARGVLDLDAPLGRYLPEVALAPPLSADAISLRDLLSMTHGIDGAGPITLRTAYTGDFTNGLLLQLLRLHPALSTGRKFDYSNLGYNLFGLVLDAQFKEGWKRVIQREVFDPLGMSSTTALMSEAPSVRLALPYKMGPSGRHERVVYAKNDANMHAAGGHLSTAADLARYLAAHLSGGRLDGRQALPEGPINATHQQQTDQDRTFGPYRRTGWALGWDIGAYDGEVILHRFGDFTGFRSHMSFLPQRGLGVAVLVNGSPAASPLSDLVATYIYERLLDRPQVGQRFGERLAAFAKQVEEAKAAIAKEAATRAARPQQTPLPLAAYTGTYDNITLGRMTWTLGAGRLRVDMGVAGCEAEVYDGPKHRFRVELTGRGEVVAFGVPPGAAVPARLQYAGATFERIR